MNQIWMDDSNDTVLTSLGAAKAVRWSSDFRPHGAYVDEIKFVTTDKNYWALVIGDVDAYHDQIQLDPMGYPEDPDITVEFSPSTLYKQLVLNSGRFPTNITAFRRAMAFGFDKYRAIHECIMGFGIPQDSYIPQIATEWEVESQLTEHFYEPDFVSGNISLENAGFIDLDDDGWREYDKNHNGLWDAGVDLDDDDPSLVMDMYATADYDPDIIVCQTAQDGLEQMGIRSNVIEKDYSTLLMDASNGSFWGFSFNTVIDPINPPAFLYNDFRTNQDSTDTIFWFSNSTIDATLDEMMAATTLEEVKEKAAEATTLLTFEQPAIVCYNKVHINGYRTDRFSGFFEFKGYGYTGRNPYCGTKVHLKDSIGGPLGSTFNMSKFGDLETTNIRLVNDVSTEMVMGYIYEKLWNIDPNTWDPIPGLAYDWDIEQTTANGDIRDGQKFTFYLYENETWHDGEPFTAADVNHSIHMWQANPNHGPEMWDIYKVEIPDNYTIELYVNETGYFKWADTTSFYVTPEHIWREVANVTAYSPPVAEVIGTGPYKLDVWIPGEHISLLRHEDWRWYIREDRVLTTSTISTDSKTSPTSLSSIHSTNSSTQLDTSFLPVLQIFELGPILFFLAIVSGASIYYVRRQYFTRRIYWEQHSQLIQLIDQLTISNLEATITTGSDDSSSGPLGFPQHLHLSEPLNREVIEQEYYSLRERILNGDPKNLLKLTKLLTQAEELLKDNKEV
jgi:ABC-type transport system substrate-binding protein